MSSLSKSFKLSVETMKTDRHLQAPVHLTLNYHTMVNFNIIPRWSVSWRGLLVCLGYRSTTMMEVPVPAQPSSYTGSWLKCQKISVCLFPGPEQRHGAFRHPDRQLLFLQEHHSLFIALLKNWIFRKWKMQFQFANWLFRAWCGDAYLNTLVPLETD